LIGREDFTTGYSRFPTKARLLQKGLGRRLDTVGACSDARTRAALLSAVRDSDLFLIQWGRLPAHLGVAATRGGERTMIHAFQNRTKTESRVVEENLTRFGDHIVEAYRIPEVIG
jgi:hypothetical protein